MTLYLITKTFGFSAAHRLPNLPAGHPCRRMHGHNYAVTLELSYAELDEQGMVLDYRALDGAKTFIDEHLDHRVLNNVLPDFEPTAENLARYLYDALASWYSLLSAVTVSETERTSATYRP